jgi:hypothetical protein
MEALFPPPCLYDLTMGEQMPTATIHPPRLIAAHYDMCVVNHH